MTNDHEADPKFLQFLEWQLRSELRRKARFGEPAARSSKWPHRLRAAAMIAFSLIAGAGVVVASEQIGDARRAELLLQRNLVKLEVAERRVEAADTEVARVKVLVEQGFLPTAALTGSTRDRADLERGAQHLRLEREEILAAGQSVSTAEAISAPMVGSRDFVADHLRVELVFAQVHLSAENVTMDRSRSLAEAQMISTAELDQATERMTSAELDVKRLESRLDLRTEFVTSGMSVESCERKAMIGDAEYRLAVTSKRVGTVERALERAKRLAAGGMASRVVAPLEVELDALQAEVRLAELELELLQANDR